MWIQIGRISMIPLSFHKIKQILASQGWQKVNISLSYHSPRRESVSFSPTILSYSEPSHSIYSLSEQRWYRYRSSWSSVDRHSWSGLQSWWKKYTKSESPLWAHLYSHSLSIDNIHSSRSQSDWLLISQEGWRHETGTTYWWWDSCSIHLQGYAHDSWFREILRIRDSSRGLYYRDYSHSYMEQVISLREWRCTNRAMSSVYGTYRHQILE